MEQYVALPIERTYHVGRDDLWFPVDWDHDGRIDLLNGVSDWRDYGWDDAFDAQGKWQRGPLHGFVYVYRNTGTNASPHYAPPQQIEANGKPIDTYGSPAPNAVDWLGDGQWSLVTGSFLDYVSLNRAASNGLAPRTERLVILVLGLALAGLRVPLALPLALGLIAILAWATVVQRIWFVRKQAAAAAEATTTDLNKEN
jgi:hypothetical protein